MLFLNPSCFPVSYTHLDVYKRQQHTYDICVTGTNLLGMICINHFVLINGLEFQQMVKKRLNAERVFPVSYTHLASAGEV